MAVRVRSLLRLSTKKQVQRQNGSDLDIPGQRRAIEEFLKTKPNWVLTHEYVEAGVSAFKNSATERDVLQDAIEDAKAGEYDILLVWKSDRLSRKAEEYPLILATLFRYGVQVWTVVEGKPLEMRTHVDKLLRFVEGWSAEGESRNTGIRVRERLKQIAQDGRWTGGRVPFGYQLVTKKDPETGEPIFQGGKPVREVVPHPEYAPIVQELFRRYAKGQGIVSLAQWLNELGVPTWQKGGVWTHHSVRVILANPFYTGKIVWRKTTYSDDGSRKVVKVDPSEWIVAEGKHEPLVSQELWDAVQAVRAASRHMNVKRREGPHFFSGVLKCGRCGYPMHGYMRRVKRRTGYAWYPVYRCSNRVTTGSCVSTTFREEVLEEAFLSEFEKRLLQPAGLGELLQEQEQERMKTIEAAKAERKRLQERLKVIENALVRLKRAYLEVGTVTDEEYAATKSEYERERDEIEARLAEPLPEPPATNVAELIDIAKNVRAIWHTWSPEEKRVFLLNFCDAYDMVIKVQPEFPPRNVAVIIEPKA
ncbi:recombinase family protein [Symbiobacterium thermophilum]|uniref:Recombinase family protein n=1 Tax=Symbiobacterium thermophilum TaxID=2734 RepID=A0A953I1W6_SYMTR|nr:recombinase family protein [Symbiobacterium thermophilum]MBY6275397.1 hypothetical protein [Symbiobacterium thermophilum]